LVVLTVSGRSEKLCDARKDWGDKAGSGQYLFSLAEHTSPTMQLMAVELCGAVVVSECLQQIRPAG